MRAALAIALLLLTAPAQARWIVRYQWVEPEPRFIEYAPTRADLRYQLCNLETPAQGYREAEARAIRCALRTR